MHRFPAHADMWRTQIHSVFKIRGHTQMVGVRLVRSSSQIPGYPHIHIFAEPCSTSHETTDTLAGMTDGAQYSQALHERSVLTANMCLEAQQRTTRPLVFALTTALDILGIERPDEKTITLTNTEKMHVHVTASNLGDEEKERMLALRVASKIGQYLSQRVGIYERLYPSMALGFRTLIAGRVLDRDCQAAKRHSINLYGNQPQCLLQERMLPLGIIAEPLIEMGSDRS